MKKINYTFIIILTLAISLSNAVHAQVSINTSGNNPDASSMLDISSDSHGLLIPRMTLAERGNIVLTGSPTGLMIYQTDNSPGFYYYDGSDWQLLIANANWTETSDSLMRINGNDTLVTITNSGNVGIGTTTPSAKLEVIDGAFLASGSTGSTPASGSGRRMMWIPAKSAFRAGYVTGTQWDNSNIGEYSIAMGHETKASGMHSTAMGSGTIASDFSSTAMGRSTTASGYYSTAMGYETTASGYYSTAMGSSTTASGHSSTAMGRNTTASGYYSTAMGRTTTASGYYCTAMGYWTEASSHSSTAMGGYTTASGYYCTAMGYWTEASGNYSTAMGHETTAPSYVETSIGQYNTTYTPASTDTWNTSDRLFVIGNGVYSSNSDAMVVLKNGNVGIGTSSPSQKLEVDGNILQTNGDYTATDQVRAIDANGLKLNDDGENGIFIENGGNVGIGTTTPSCPLEVNGSASLTATYGYLNSSGTTGTAGPQTNGYSIKASHRIMATEFNAVSDRRIKTNIKVSNNISDLQKIVNLKVSEYNYIDSIGKGNTLQKGFIAQEVEQFIPEAVNTHSDFIPDVFTLATNLTKTENIVTIELSKAHKLMQGDLIRLITPAGQLDKEVLKVISANSFSVSMTKEPESVFVYGKKVDDFRVVNYDYIFSTGIGAIQELSTKVEELENSNKYLQSKVEQIDKLTAEVEALKSLIIQENNLAAKTVLK